MSTAITQATCGTNAPPTIRPDYNKIIIVKATKKPKPVNDQTLQRNINKRHRTYQSVPTTWFNKRSDEAKAKIYRIPPPGNGQNRRTPETPCESNTLNKPTSRQTNMTEFFPRRTNMIQHATSTTINNNDIEGQSLRRIAGTATANITPTETGRQELKILQWNACSLNSEKRAHLEFLAEECNFDIICISELGNYRKISGFPQYEHSDIGTQSAIFWKRNLEITRVATEFDKKHPRILTQCVNVNSELLLIHSYIAPDLSHSERGEYWKQLLDFIDEWCNRNAIRKVLVTGDLNTRDRRFGNNHRENHSYLDEVLLHLEVVNDIQVPTREENTLDITMVNCEATECILEHKVLPALNSDHNPTSAKIQLNWSPYSNSRNQSRNENTTEYIVMDIQKTRKQLHDAIQQTDTATVTLEKINNILRESVAYKKTHLQPINQTSM